MRLLLLAAVFSLAARGATFDEVRARYRASELRVLDRHGVLIDESRVDRAGRRLAWVPLDAVSPAVIAAVLRAEDRRFFSHGGVDWRAAGAALWQSAWGRGSRGASTITMQLAAVLDPGLARRGSRGVWQKWRQMSEAWSLERRWTKPQLLEAYLNLVGFRGELRGIAAASRGLFDKDPHGVGEAEGVILASLLRSPGATAAQVETRACRLGRALRAEFDCAQLGAMLGTALGTVPRIPPRVRLAPQAARSLAKGRAPGATVLSSLDGGLQRFATEALLRQGRLLSSQNARDGAVLVVDNLTGEVLVYVGGMRGHVDGVTALRQAGSTLKPFLYGLALERRLLTAASLLDDSPLDVAVSRGVYRPENYDHRFHGLVPLRTALSSSLNIPAVRTLLVVGVDPFVERLGMLGFRKLEASDYYGPSAALGAVDVTLWDLVAAYRTLANGGAWSPLRLVPGDIGPPEPPRPVMPPEVAFVVGDMLADRSARALTFGLGNNLSTRVWSAVKTGTSKDMRDNWCVGYSAKYTVGVWMGNFSGDPMWDVSGTSGAAPVWAELMQRLHDPEPGFGAPVPPVGVAKKSVRVAGRVIDEWFLSGTETAEVVSPVASRPARILYPTEGMVLAVDPDIPPSRQALHFEAESDGTLRWKLDGRDLGPGTRTVRWRLEPGSHRLVLADARGVERDSLRFSVRGAGAEAP